MIFLWRFAGGAHDELLALRVLLFDFVAIILRMGVVREEDFVSGPRIYLEGNRAKHQRHV